MDSTELDKAACMWLQHRGWKIQKVASVGGTRENVKAVCVVAARPNIVQQFVVIQNWIWFDPVDFRYNGDSDSNHFLVPKYDEQDEDHAIVCFNSSRTYAVFVPIEVNHSIALNFDGRKWIHREDIHVLDVPVRLWAMDRIPEWLHRGWPNVIDADRCGEVSKPDTWLWHSAWTEKVLELAEPYQRLPTCVDEAPNFNGWRSKKWYRVYLETHDDLVLPWTKTE